MGIDPVVLARAIRRNRRRCIAVDLELLELLRLVDKWRELNPGTALEFGDVVGLGQGRQAVRRIGTALEADAIAFEERHGLPPQDEPPPPPAAPRSRAAENLDALKRSLRGSNKA